MEVIMKKCYICKEFLDFDKFNKNKSKPDKLATECKSCKAKQDKEYRSKNNRKIKETKHIYYLNNKEDIKEKVCIYIKANPERHNKWCADAKNKLKHDVFSIYSCGEPKCKNCEEKDIGLLTIDHIDGDGSAHRQETFGNKKVGGYKMYQWIKKNSYPENFQVLCYNCQYRKRLIEMRPENPSEKQLKRSKYARGIKMDCIHAYGSAECKCGEKDADVLTLDHVNDDGAKHRLETKTRGNNFYFMLRRNGFPNDPPLQVLCMNCNIRKRNEKYQEGKV